MVRYNVPWQNLNAKLGMFRNNRTEQAEDLQMTIRNKANPTNPAVYSLIVCVSDWSVC